MDILSRHNVHVTGPDDGQPIVFAHGFGCDQHMWHQVARHFEEDFRIVLFDHIGAGDSDLAAYDEARHGSLNGYAHDVLDVCHALDLHDVVFVGHSVSAMIGALAAVIEPDLFAKLVLVGPSPRYINDGDYIGGFDEQDIADMLESLDSNYLGWSSAMAPAIIGNPNRPQLGQTLTESFCRTDPEIARRFARVTFTSDNRADLALVTTPTLVLQCSNDIIAPVPVGEFVHDAIAGSTYQLLDATGHCPNLSAPDETAAAIATFVRG